ncbi:MAG: tetratricopeptide repeat protein, partial [Saprospiraceae bacterium]
MTQGYIFHDMMLGRIMDFVDDDTYLMLVSDHGFQPDHLRPRVIPSEPAGPAYEHSPYGVFVLKGPGIKKDEIVYGASLLDVTPTILKIFDLPVGEDMDGKVLEQVFTTSQPTKTISSWEAVEGDCGMHSKTVGEDESIAERALQQLIDLGYIEAPSGNADENRRKTHDECQFNLAKALIDGGFVERSIPILEKLYKNNPNVSRYAMLLATSYQTMTRLPECRKVIESMRTREMFDDATLDVMEGSLLLGERQPIRAIKLFKKVENQLTHPNPQVQLQIARGYIQLKRWQDAERALQRKKKKDPHHADAYALLGRVYLLDRLFDPY